MKVLRRAKRRKRRAESSKFNDESFRVMIGCSHSAPSLARLEETLDPSRTGRAGGESWESRAERSVASAERKDESLEFGVAQARRGLCLTRLNLYSLLSTLYSLKPKGSFSYMHEVMPSAVASAVSAAMRVCTAQLQMRFLVSLSMVSGCCKVLWAAYVLAPCCVRAAP